MITSGDNRLRLIIPSFNRACQLECLLRSLYENCPAAPNTFSICVFYRFTDSAYSDGYELVKRLYPGIEYVEQRLDRSFKRQFLDQIDGSEFFGFIVDDMVVIDGFSTADRPFALLKARSDILSLSLRLDIAKTFSQPVNEAAKSPAFDEDYVWRWKPNLPRNWRLGRFLDKAFYKGAFFDWAFPCALDGTVYRTVMFREFFQTIEDFTNIPFMEHSLSQALMRFRDSPPNMVRYPRSKVISLAMNSVDEYHDYPSLGLDPRRFNELFLAGRRLDYRPFQKIVFHACHVVTQPFWLSD